MSPLFQKIIAVTATLFLCSDMEAAFILKQRNGNVDTKLKIYGFAQLEARGGDGAVAPDQKASVLFRARNVRLGMNYATPHLGGKLFVDFNKPATDKGGVGLPDIVKDAFAAYRFNSAMVIKAGLMKMPHGMSFTMPGWNLDIVGRGFDKALAMERSLGIMISGRGIGYDGNRITGFEMGYERPWRGFGYDLMVANQAGRSGAVTAAKPGNANGYALRLMYDWTETLHLELSYAISEHAGGIKGQRVGASLLGEDTSDYRSLNFGIDSHFGPGNVKCELFRSKNLKGVSGWDEDTYALTGTYYLNPTLELAAKFIVGRATREGIDTDLSNTYLGINYYIDPFDSIMNRAAKRARNAHRIQLDYVIAGGDTDTWNGLKGYRDDAWLLQYQYKF